MAVPGTPRLPHAWLSPWGPPSLAGEEYQPLLPSPESSLRILSTALSPLDHRKWRRKPWYWRLFKIFKVNGGDVSWEEHPPAWGIPLPASPWGCVTPGRWWDKGDRSWGISWGVLSRGSPIPAHGCSSQVPVELLLLLTVPVVDPDKDDLNWKRPLNCLHIVTSPLLCILTLKSGTCKSPR